MDEQKYRSGAGKAFRKIPRETQIGFIGWTTDPQHWRDQLRVGEADERLKEATDCEVWAIIESVATNPLNWEPELPLARKHDKA